MHVLANSAALERKEVSGVLESSPHLERHLGSRKDSDTDSRRALKQTPRDVCMNHTVISSCGSVSSHFPPTQFESYCSAII